MDGAQRTVTRRIGGSRPSPIFLLFVALAGAGGVLAARDTASLLLQGVGVFVLVVAGWVVTLCLHEFAHAYGAYRGGDRSVVEAGYLTLNPFRYAHPVLSIVLPLVFIALGGIGLPGGAVYLHRHALRSRAWQSAVALAGPATNAVFAVVLLEVVKHFSGTGSVAVTGVLASEAHRSLWAGLAFLGYLQITAVILNLLPVPGLDGYAAIEPWLSAQTAKGFEPFKGFGMLFIIAILQIGRFNAVFFGWVDDLYGLSGADRGLAALGNELLRFWNLR